MMTENFQNTTTLTIAHRLGTIINYDRILVLDRGTLAEYGPPQVLIDAQETAESVVHKSEDSNDTIPIITRGIFASMYREYIKSADSARNSSNEDSQKNTPEPSTNKQPEPTSQQPVVQEHRPDVVVVDDEPKPVQDDNQHIAEQLEEYNAEPADSTQQRE